MPTRYNLTAIPSPAPTSPSAVAILPWRVLLIESCNDGTSIAAEAADVRVVEDLNGETYVQAINICCTMDMLLLFVDVALFDAPLQRALPDSAQDTAASGISHLQDGPPL